MSIQYLITILICGAGGVLLGWLISSMKLQRWKTERAVLQNQNSALQQDKQDLQKQVAAGGQHGLSMATENAALKESNKHLQEKLATQLLEQQEMQQQLKIQFHNLANRILEENSEKFSKQNQNNLTQLLDPLKEKIQVFEKEIRDTHKESLKQNSALSEQIRLLKELGLQMSEEARGLSLALKGDNKAQGNWGELILERVLEFSGLQKGREYDTQVSLQGDNGNKLVPDAIIYLPEQKHLVVDSKVSLVAYEALVNTNEENEKSSLLLKHLRSIKNHIDGLSERHYISAKGIRTPDFVLMFIPVESCLSISLQADGQLFEYAWKRKVVLVTPTTFLATLKTVSSLWKYEKQNANALEIADMGRKLYEQFVSFLKEMEKIDRGLNAAGTAFGEAMKRLKDGQRSIINRVEKLKELGVSPKEDIDNKYLDRDYQNSIPSTGITTENQNG